MRRRRRVYVIKSGRSSARSSKRLFSQAKALADLQGIAQKPFRPLPRLHQVVSDLEVTAALSPLSSPPLNQSLKPGKVGIRRQLKWVTGVSAMLGWAATMVGYFDIRDYDEGKEVEGRDGVRTALWTLSTLQAALIFVYNVKVLHYSEFLRTAYNTHPLSCSLQAYS